MMYQVGKSLLGSVKDSHCSGIPVGDQGGTTFPLALSGGGVAPEARRTLHSMISMSTHCSSFRVIPHFSSKAIQSSKVRVVTSHQTVRV